MTGGPGWCADIACRACVSPDGPDCTCCSPDCCLASRRRPPWWRMSAPRQGSAKVATASNSGVCARRRGSAGPARSPSSITLPWTLSRPHFRPLTAPPYGCRCTDRRSSLRCPCQSLRQADHSTSNIRSRRLRSTTENPHVETGYGDPRDRRRQFRSDLPGPGGCLLPARSGMLRWRTLLRPAADPTNAEATARATGRWLFSGMTGTGSRAACR